MKAQLQRASWLFSLIATALLNSGSVNAGSITAENLILDRPQGVTAIGFTNESTVTNSFLKQSFRTDAIVFGELESISLDVVRKDWTTDPLTVSLYTASGSLPNILPGTMLGSVTEPLTSFPFGVGNPTTIDFSSHEIFLDGNTDYVITASVLNPLATYQYLWHHSGDSGYVPGDAARNNGGLSDPWTPLSDWVDLGFGVVVVPEPSTALLLAFGLLGIAAQRRRLH
jgi:hypothetical protein